MKVRELREVPRAINDSQQLPAISSYLDGAGTARLLMVPLYAASKLVGFVDARDKGRKRLFEPDDIRRARIIARALLDLLRESGLMLDLEPAPEAPLPPVEAVPLAEMENATGVSPGRSLLDEVALGGLQETCQRCLRRGSVAAVALTVAHAGSAATSAIASDAGQAFDLEPVQQHHAAALRREGISVPEPGSWKLRLLRSSQSVVARGPRSIATAVLLREEGWALVASVVGLEAANASEEALADLQAEARVAREATSLRYATRMLARRLLHPGDREYAELETHSLAVSRLCWGLARAEALSDGAAEEAAVAGLVHDVGMREIDYDTLYRHPAPGPEERRRYAEHVVLGEQLARELGLDRVARAVRHHHERWDGNGYPDRIAGGGIPLLSRMIHVAEVFDVLTSEASYRRPVNTSRALEIMRSARGQFDPRLVDSLSAIVR